MQHGLGLEVETKGKNSGLKDASCAVGFMTQDVIELL